MWQALLVVAILAVAGVALIAHFVPTWRRWGATEEEANAHYPHDDIVPSTIAKAVRAITIHAPAAEVWPWVAQIGRGAGFYSIDFLDNRGCRSADYVMDLPPPALGDQTVVGRLVSCQPGDHVAYHAPDSPFLGARWNFCMGHAIRPLDGNRTRLLQIVRIGHQGGSRVVIPFAVFCNDIMETIMGIVQLRKLKRVIESYPARLKSGDVHRVPGRHGHQSGDFSYAGEKAD